VGRLYDAFVAKRAQFPLLFLDVDGPLIPFGANAAPVVLNTAASGNGNANPLISRLDPLHGPWLTALPCDLVWATSWMADANDYLAPLLGLPALPVVNWPEVSESEELDARRSLHWKTRTLVAWAAGRAFAWVDDEISDIDRAWVAEHHDGKALLHRVNPHHGLTDSDYLVLDTWLRTTATHSMP
jgi:HAD domain in Swiss Army Knife RNA repair proteins